MAVTIIVEDGSGVEGANSYISVADLDAAATNRGITLPLSTDAKAVMLIKAMDYIESVTDYLGRRVYPATAWPRSCVYIGCEAVAEDEIPQQLKLAQTFAAFAVNDGIDLTPNAVPGDFVIEEKVDVLQTRYANPLSVGIQPRLTLVTRYLDQLRQGGGALRTERA